MSKTTIHSGSSKKKWFAALVTVAILVAGTVAYIVIRNRDADSTLTTKLTVSDPPKQKVRESPTVTAATKHYVSANFMLEFDYPKDWAVTDEAGSGHLTAISPSMGLKDTQGKTVTGQIILTIRNKQQALPEFDKGNAVAARESEKINYTKPSSVQRGSTYLSFLRYASSTPGGLNGVYVTGNVGYKLAQAIPKADFTPVDPVISLTFQKCAEACNSKTNTVEAVVPTLWDDPLVGVPLKTMLQSLIVN